MGDDGIRVGLWFRELRAPFFTATIVPVVLGTILASQAVGTLDWTLFALTMAAALCLHAGANMANDYFDFRSGCDSHPQYQEFSAPFFGGSRLLPEGLLEANDVHRAALASIGCGVALGILIVWRAGWPVLLFGLVGVLSGYLYVVALAPRGLGEIAVFLNFGPLMVLGSYYVQAGSISWASLLVSIPIGILISAVLWINEISDIEPDRAAAKNTLVVRLGRERAVHVYLVLILSSYGLILAYLLSGVVPILGIISLISLPIAVKSTRLALRHSFEPSRMVPANGGTVVIHGLTGLMLAAAYPLSSLIQSLA